jgi:tetratricopeptide (TPR) repeat protein
MKNCRSSAITLVAAGFVLLQSGSLSISIAFAQQTKVAATAIPVNLTPEAVGDSHLVHGEFQAAIDAYNSIPDPSAELLNKIGFAYQHLYAIDKARAAYERALRLQPNFPRALNNLGAIFYEQRQFSKAEQLYRRALKLGPGDATIAKNLGAAYIAQGDMRKGMEAYRIAFEDDPNTFSDDAQGVISAPGSPQVRSNQDYCFAELFAHAGMNSQALEYLRRAMDSGFEDYKRLKEDPDFAALRKTPEFAQLMSQQRRH